MEIAGRGMLKKSRDRGKIGYIDVRSQTEKTGEDGNLRFAGGKELECMTSSGGVRDIGKKVFQERKCMFVQVCVQWL